MRSSARSTLPCQRFHFRLRSSFSICLERKGSESYLSRDKAVLFFEVNDINAAVAAIGRERFVWVEPTWAVLHDPEGHNVLLLKTGHRPLT